MRIQDYPLTLKATHVAEIMGVSRATAYAYMKQAGFPSFKMPGSKSSIRVVRDQFYAWMMEQGENRGA